MNQNNYNIMCITSSYPVHPRLQKIGDSFKNFVKKNKGIEIVYVAWDRLSMECKGQSHEWVYLSREGYGNRFNKLLGLLAYTKFIGKKTKEFNPDVIVCRYLDMAFIGCFFSKKRKLVYDINDIPSDKNPLIAIIYRILEWFVLKKCDVIILSSRFFIDRYKLYEDKIEILENKPDKNIRKQGIFDFEKKRFIVSFIGVIRFYSILENLIMAVKDRDVDLLFFGHGPDEDKIKKLIARHQIKNVHMFGRYSYDDIHKLYNISDLIWAAYPAATINTRTAISNKFFESLLFRKPGVFNKNTRLGEHVNHHGIGLTINPEVFEDIDRLLEDVCINQEQYTAILKNMDRYIEQNPSCWDGNRSEKISELLNI